MKFEKLASLIKEAKLSDGLNLLPAPEKIKPIAPINKLPEPPKPPEIKEPPALKLDNGLGKSKPSMTHELKNNSPYNER